MPRKLETGLQAKGSGRIGGTLYQGIRLGAEVEMDVAEVEKSEQTLGAHEDTRFQ
jgi:hypothetical protein